MFVRANLRQVGVGIYELASLRTLNRNLSGQQEWICSVIVHVVECLFRPVNGGGGRRVWSIEHDVRWFRLALFSSLAVTAVFIARSFFFSCSSFSHKNVD